MNHRDTLLELNEEGISALFGPNGAGKSVEAEALNCIEGDRQLSRFSSFYQAFKKYQEGYVEVGVYITETEIIRLMRRCRNKTYDYKVDGKTVSSTEFHEIKKKYNIFFNASNMIGQGQVAKHFKGKGPKSLRTMVERITGDNKYVEIYNEIKEKTERISILSDIVSKKIGQLNTISYKLKEEAKIIKHHQEIQDKIVTKNYERDIVDFHDKLGKLSKISKVLKKSRRSITSVKKRIKSLGVNRDQIVEGIIKIEQNNKAAIDEINKIEAEIKVLESILSQFRENIEEAKTKTNLERKFTRLSIMKENIEKVLSNFDLNEIIEEITTVKSNFEQSRNQINILEERTEELVKQIEEAKNYKIDDEILDSLQEKMFNLSQEKKAVLNEIIECQDIENDLKKERITHPKALLSFEQYMKQNNIDFIGPVCYSFKLKEGIQNRNQLRDLMLRVISRDLSTYFVFNIKDKMKAIEYLRNNKNNRYNIKINSLNTNDRPIAKRRIAQLHKFTKEEYDGKIIGYFADFIESSELLNPLIWQIFGRVLLVSSQEIADIVASKYSIPVLTIDADMTRPKWPAGTTTVKTKKHSHPLENHFGMDDPITIQAKREEIKDQLSNLRKKREEISNVAKEANEKYQQLIWEKKIISELPSKKDELVENKNRITQITKDCDDLEQKMIQLSQKKESFLSMDSRIKKLNSRINEINKFIDVKGKMLQTNEKIKNLREKLEESDIEEKRIRLEDLKSWASSVEDWLSNKLNKKDKHENQLNEMKASRIESYKALRRAAIRVDTRKGFKVSVENTLNKKIELENEIDQLKLALPSIIGLDKKAPQKYERVSKRIEDTDLKLSTLRKSSKNLRNELKKVSQEWSEKFTQKVNKIEADTNKLINFLGIGIKINVNPSDIENAELSINVFNQDSVLEAEMLSGGQKSLLNIAIFLGANYFSDNHFFLLDELDQNLDPHSTKMVKEILLAFAEKHQVLLLTPAKDPQMLQGADLIYIDDKGNGAELKRFENNQNNSTTEAQT